MFGKISKIRVWQRGPLDFSHRFEVSDIKEAKPFRILNITDQEVNNEAHRISQ